MTTDALHGPWPQQGPPSRSSDEREWEEEERRRQEQIRAQQAAMARHREDQERSMQQQMLQMMRESVAAKAVKNEYGFLPLFLTATGLFVFDAFAGFSRTQGVAIDSIFMLYALATAMVYVLILRKAEEHDQGSRNALFFWAFAGWLLPILLGLPFLDAFRGEWWASPFLYPVFPLFAAIHYEGKSKVAGWIVSFFAILYIILLFVFVASASFAGSVPFVSDTLSPTTTVSPREFLAGGFSHLVSLPGTVGSMLSGAVNQRIFSAAGPYAEGKGSDDTTVQLVGFYIEDNPFGTTQVKTFEAEKSAKVTAILKEHTALAPEVRFTSVSCLLDDEPAGSASPPSFTHFRGDERPVSCEFTKDELTTGTHDVTVAAAYEYATLSSVDTFLMDRQRRRQYESDRDALERACGLERPSVSEPVTINAPNVGHPTAKDPPVFINFKVGEPPFLVCEQENNEETCFAQPVAIVMTLEHEGAVHSISMFNVTLPPGLELVNSATCPFNPKQVRESDGTVRDVYEIDEAEIQQGAAFYEFLNEAGHRGFTCDVKMTDRALSLGGAACTPVSFQAAALYNFEVESEQTIKVEPIAAGTGETDASVGTGI